MFAIYLAKVYHAVQRQLSKSEIDTVRDCFDNSYAYTYAVELLK